MKAKLNKRETRYVASSLRRVARAVTRHYHPDKRPDMARVGFAADVRKRLRETQDTRQASAGALRMLIKQARSLGSAARSTGT